jgi:hypothetical protein
VADDAVLVALIKESVVSESRPRRIAARLLLDDLRTDPTFRLTSARAETVRADAGPEVATEMYDLARRLGLPTPER